MDQGQLRVLIFQMILVCGLWPMVCGPSVFAQAGRPSGAILNQLRFGNQEELEESRRILESEIAFDPGNADYHFELSRVYGALYDESLSAGAADAAFLDKSQNSLEQVLMIRPGDIPAHYNLGVIYKRRKKMELARDAFYRVIHLSQKETAPSSVAGSAWLQIGSIYEDQGFYEDAHDAYMKARELGGPRPEIQTALDDLRSRQKEFEKTPPRRPDSWNREYISGADYAQFGADALRARNQSAGLGALLPVAGALLFQQFMERRDKVNSDS